MKRQEIRGRRRTPHGNREVQVFVGDKELERENRVSSASTEGNPRGNILVRAKSEPNDLTAYKSQ